ncbi:MAG: Dabb family protein [Acidimicrobiia bacterium]|nr:Dabb family protein [Acidimicrobiia bacterium]
MTIRHCVMLRFTEGTSADAIDAVTTALRDLPALIPEIRVYDVGPDLGWRDDNAHFGIVADFDDEVAWRTYVDHPAHQAAIAEHIAPIVESRTAVQFSL